jgi:hypothetical protein
MKTLIYRISLLFTGLFVLAACNDKNNNPEPALTNCTGCQFLFTENADLMVPGYNLKTGNYRVFWSEVKKNFITQKLFIKAPMAGTSFTLTQAGILAGRVEVLDICAQCNMITMLPIGGSVTGKNVTPSAKADEARWLIEAKIIRAPAENTSGFKDTVYVKQYFTANFAFN